MKPGFSLLYDGQPFCAELNTEGQPSNSWELAPNVTVSASMKQYPAYDAMEWVLSFENKGSESSGVISEIWDCDTFLTMEVPEWKKEMYLPDANSLCVVTMNGSVLPHYYWENEQISATEFQFNYEYLEKSVKRTKRFSNRGGRSSDGIMPFFDVTANGAGYIVAIGWTGDWKSEFVGSRERDGVTVRTGLKRTGFYLKPQEKLRTSSVLVMKYTSEEDRYNKFRGLMRDQYTPRVKSGILAFLLWGSLSSDEMKKRIGELKSHHVGFEQIWIDAAWYGEHGKGGWSNQTGNWVINREDHPDDLLSVRDAVEDAGMSLMFWMEPERAKTNTRIFEEHPDWFLSLPDQMGERGDHVLNYGHPQAREYALELISGYIDRLHITCYRQDFNIDLTPYFEGCDEQDRIGIAEIKHIMGLYEIYDALLERHPGLMIDNCASGGRRIDIEMLKRSIQFFKSDYQCNIDGNPEVFQVHNTNAAMYFPFVGCITIRKSDTYAVRSSYISNWGGGFYYSDFLTMDENDLEWARRSVDEYKRIRHYFTKDYYNHGSTTFDKSSWTIWQYHDAGAKKGILMAFRRENSPFASVDVALNGVEDGAKIRFLNFDTEESWEGSRDLTVLLKDRRSSVIIEYTVS